MLLQRYRINKYFKSTEPNFFLNLYIKNFNKTNLNEEKKKIIYIKWIINFLKNNIISQTRQKTKQKLVNDILKRNIQK